LKSEYFSKDYLIAIGIALFVTILWSSSFVIIKFGLEELSPLLFAGLRYSLGAIILLCAIFFKDNHRSSIKVQSKQWWTLIVIYGIIFIFITQGGQFIALNLLPAITVSFVLNLTPFVVILFSVGLLKEVPSLFQLFFFFIVFIGIIFYFFPVDLLSAEIQGIIIVFVLMIANSFSSILGRVINRTKEVSPVIITGFSMGIGAFFLIIYEISMNGIEPFFSLTLQSILIIVWLGVLNTAVAFTLWNKAMQKLRAMDISLINSTMLPQIVILSILFLGEMPILKEWVGLILITISTLIIQLNQASRNSTENG
jgi:drug/metabolite transporter (DMT)-like permease